MIIKKTETQNNDDKDSKKEETKEATNQQMI